METDAFRLVNDLPSVPFPVVWVPMDIVPASAGQAVGTNPWPVSPGARGCASRSSEVRTAVTPGSARAAAASIDSTTAEA